MAGSSSDMIKIAAQRIKRELRGAARSDELRNSGVKLELVGDSYLELLGEIGGPPDTPYKGGRFQLEIKVPDSYPFNAPKVRFINHVWHPNISSVTGAVCLDILKDQWAAAMTLRTVFLSLQALLCAPEPDDPQDAVVGQQCKNFPDLFQATARYWTRVYAGAKEGGPWEEKFEEFDTKIREMRMRGVEDVSARAILSGCNWDVAEAIERSFN